jgi:hypothetical protein
VISRSSETQTAGVDDRGLERQSTAPNHRAQPRQQLTEIEGLDQIVVGAAVETRDARLDGVSRREHQHGDVRSGLTQLPAHVEPVDARQHDVEHHRVVLGDGCVVERLLAASRHVDGIRLLPQALGEHLRGTRLIFDQQHPHEADLVQSYVIVCSP